ncbi:phosphomannomutase/phosphoglucomutase [Granulicatella sp. zg-ZJ]|uniref:phosphomannomutase/phosphoglucomutase n=1 Tax=Granulicatella sp. zg-ZJ TaxID=2678504 RepID=UPI0013D47F7A|nr:phosphomannomutase/phosphoglucomutase [Granulicatella sp. zg-ZJ]NEW62119.1 phosphomannomutase/phosphoglucomutase [Granulicatella sp. zg-ZJ]
MSSLQQLQNGSDIRGIAISTTDYEANLTEKEIPSIVSGIIHWARQTQENKYQNGTLTIGIGRDSRISGETLVNAFIQSAREQGVNLIDFGLATTPAMFMSTQFEMFKCDIGIMITASHLPYYFNGIKIFSAVSGAEHDDIDYILSHTTPNTNGRIGTIKTDDILTPYAQDLVQKIKNGMQTTDETPLKNMHIIVDAGNGAGGFFVDKVLGALGANTAGSQFLEPDGTFPNHIPNPDNKEAMESIKEAVIRHQADLGIIFDTDVDRSAIVTKSGHLLNRNNLIAVLSQIVLREHPHSTIVTNSPTSSHLKVFIEHLGGKQCRYISGYRNVINKAIQLNKDGVNCPLAIETSGHAAFKENYFLDDGAYVIAKCLMLLPTLMQQGKTFDDLISTLKQPVETLEVRFKLSGQHFKEQGQRVIQDLENTKIDGFQIDYENEEGVRFNITSPYGNGWFLLRLSLHEPLLVLQIENDEMGFMPSVLKTLHHFFNQFDFVNQEKLRVHLNEENK